MKLKILMGTVLIVIGLLAIMPKNVEADQLIKEDFLLEYFSKTVDFFDYARAYATLHGIQIPSGFDKWHAYLYMNYINTSGLQLFYAGLNNITFDNEATFRVPMQSLIMHYKTDNRKRDVILASTFLMLLAFNETTSSLYPGSPDMNDNLWASFSMGFDLTSLNATLPALSSKTEQIPLAHTDDKLQWTWGMRYTNLTALWWRTTIDPANPSYNSSWPVAITVYDELTFTYNLTIDPATSKATLTENHVVGRMRHLLLGIIPFLWVHYNSTGTYWLGIKIPGGTLYDFIEDNQIKMSIVSFKTCVLADRETFSQTAAGQSVGESEVSIGSTSVTTYADDGEKICKDDFGAKMNYELYNYTENQYENVSNAHEATTRTAKAAGFAGNAGLFTYHLGLMRFLPLVIVHMYPGMYARALASISNMSRANYFYLIGYPNYGGYRVEHDPILTIYLTTTQASGDQGYLPPNIGGLIIIGAIAISATVVVALVLVRRKSPQSARRQPKQSPVETLSW